MGAACTNKSSGKIYIALRGAALNIQDDSYRSLQT